MGPLRHAGLAAATAAAFLWATRDRRAAALVFASGTLIDADHLVDYLLSEGLRFDGRALLSGSYFRKQGRAIVPLHSYELVALAAAGIWSRWGARAAVGLLAGIVPHLAADVVTYRFSPACYSLAYRASRGFRLSSFRPQASLRIEEERKAQ